MKPILSADVDVRAVEAVGALCYRSMDAEPMNWVGLRVE